MATAKTAQSAKVENQVADAATKGFEQLTAMAPESVKEQLDRTMTAVTEMGTFSKENMEAVVASATAYTKGVEAISARAAAFSKQAVENHMSAAKSIMTSRSVQELVERQSAYAKSAFEGYVSELNQVSEIFAGVTKQAMQPFNERVSAVGQLVQAGMQPLRAR